MSSSPLSLSRPEIKPILVLGGSYGGLSITHYLLKHVLPALAKEALYQVVLISSSSQAMCRPACPRALISDDMFPQDKLFVDVKKQLEQYEPGSWKFVHGTATQVDHKKRDVTVKLNGTEVVVLNFHALVIATGASTPSPLLGLNTDEIALREAWGVFRNALSSAKSIVIAGGGPAGVEVAGELGEHLNGRTGWLASRRGNPKVAITLITSGHEILPALRPSIARTAEQYLATVGVTIIKETKVSHVSPPMAGLDISSLVHKVILALSNDTSLEADLYIPTTGTRPNTSFLSKALLDGSRRVITSSTTYRVRDAGPLIYAIGDVSSSARPAIHNIIAAIPVLGANIKRDLLTDTGKPEHEVGPDKLFKEDTRETQLVPIGKSKGVGAAMGWRLPSWLVWIIKGRDYWLWTTGKLWSGRQWEKEG
ncbi:hypothetical protein BKA66DRAFT_404524 [Pyrenochaeta sp. MPI-SDFR-AT-0127]|nr:hypothetical protein BKA66DRAFT_404524 [Pyrenochaeta sp. MPI-SDFR-AT-0127]